MTSIRDIAKEERVGETVLTSAGPRYIPGIVETLLTAPSRGFGQYVELAGVVTDDLPKDLAGTHYTPKPLGGGHWIHPLSLRRTDGASPQEFTRNIPSTFRTLPLSAVSDRAAMKLAFEAQVAATMEEMRADVILSDSFMGRIEFLINPGHFGLFGRVLNIHPGISRGDHPYSCRGKDPARDALLHAQGIRRDPISSQLQPVEPHFLTGASLHLVSEHIDDGPVVCEEEIIPIHPNDSEAEISARINVVAKPRVTTFGLIHIAAHLHPMNGTPPDWGNLQSVTHS